MGKAQSKRSVDITTETKKGTEDEITEKMEKIEDLDKKEVINGDATLSEKNDPEKKESEDVENDKDMTTEKDDVQASGDAADPQNIAEISKDEGVGSAIAEEISPLADENIKKSKKEKVKKKWSFRNISFGKKDKQKPAKTDDAAEDGSAAPPTNGADSEEKAITEPEDTQKDKSTNEKEEKTTENHENGSATPQELNGGELNEEKTSDGKSNDITANTTNNTIATETSVSVQKETAAVSSELSEKTENTGVTNETKILGNAAVDDASKNGNGIDEKINAKEQQEPLKTDVAASASAEAPSEKTSTLGSAVTTNMSSASTNGEVVDQIHQNGDHGESEQEVIEKAKAQIEVNFNTDNKVSAASLNYISTTSINPSNVQIHIQDLNESSEKPDEIIQIVGEESVVQKSTDIEAVGSRSRLTAVKPSLTTTEAAVVNVIDVENKIEIEMIVSDLATSEAVDNEKSLVEEKLGVDPSPPPLPISPPPSQVSMFAFTNNVESIEDSIQSKTFEKHININEEEKEELLSLSPPPPSPLSQPPPISQVTDTTIPGEKSVEQITSHDQVLPQIQMQAQGQVVQVNTKLDELLPSVAFSEESVIEEDEQPSVDVAAAVINEIAERAAEIVNQQFECTEEKQITDERSSQNDANGEEQQDESVKENIIVECTNKNENDDGEGEDHIGCQVFDCKIVNSSEEVQEPSLPLVSERSNDITTECSFDLTTSDRIQPVQGETIPIRKSEHLDPIKEFATARDIKDNVTVAEITQDLSVTCE